MSITEVSRFVAEDGTEFRTRAAAEKYAQDVTCIDWAMAPLAARPDDFPHNGFLQHDLAAFTTAWNNLLGLAEELMGPHDWFTQSRDLKADASWAGRLIGELDHKAIWGKGWFRMSCTDRKTGREYQQPYYATHSEELEVIVCLNPTPAEPLA